MFLLHVQVWKSFISMHSFQSEKWDHAQQHLKLAEKSGWDLLVLSKASRGSFIGQASFLSDQSSKMRASGSIVLFVTLMTFVKLDHYQADAQIFAHPYIWMRGPYQVRTTTEAPQTIEKPKKEETTGTFNIRHCIVTSVGLFVKWGVCLYKHISVCPDNILLNKRA